MTWALRSRVIVIAVGALWMVAAALPIEVQYPSVRAGIQSTALGAATAILPMAVWMWQRARSVPERLLGSFRATPACIDGVTLASVPVYAAVLDVLGGGWGSVSAPGLSLGALTLIAGRGETHPRTAALSAGYFAVSFVLGPLPGGGREAWAIPIANEMSPPLLIALIIAFLAALGWFAVSETSVRRLLSALPDPRRRVRSTDDTSR